MYDLAPLFRAQKLALSVKEEIMKKDPMELFLSRSVSKQIAYTYLWSDYVRLSGVVMTQCSLQCLRSLQIAVKNPYQIYDLDLGVIF